MESSVFHGFLYALIATLIIVCIKYFSLILSTIKTIPRDIHGLKCLVSLQAACKSARWKNQTVSDLFDITARKYPDKVCFYFEDEEWTFLQVQQYSNRVANYFYNEGYRKGDKVAFIMENRPEYIAGWLGLSRIGVMASLININLKEESLKHVLELLSHKGIIYEEATASEALKDVIALGYKPARLFCAKKSCNSNLQPEVKNLLESFQETDLDSALTKASAKFDPEKHDIKINFEDPLLYSFTSGTTGFPKAALIKHSRFIFAGYGTVHVMEVKHSDIQYIPLPLYHTTAGMLGLGSALFNGTSIVLRKKFSASNFWRDCCKYNVTVAQYIGETLRYLYSQPESEYDKIHKVRKLFGLGLRQDLWADFVQRFEVSDIKELYGSTEGNCNMVNIDATPGSCGFIPRLVYSLAPYKLMKVTEDGEIIRDRVKGHAIQCQPNEPGELIGRIYPKDPLRNFEGYSDKASTEKKILRNLFTEGDSYFRSGDLLVMDDLGYFYFKDRSGDTFRWKGENVSTQQVELVISRICDLADVAVYGVTIPGTEGRAGMAALALGGGDKMDFDSQLQHLATEIQRKLPNYARPLFLRIMDRLEVTSTHKIKKANLQKEGFANCGNDRVFYLENGKYVPLTLELSERILKGNVRL